MQLCLQLLQTARPKSSLPDSIFGAVGALANAMEQGFAKYMESFMPFLLSALDKTEEPEVCAIGVGLVSDLSRSLGEAIQPYCDAFMNSLLQTLTVRISPYLWMNLLVLIDEKQSTTFSKQVKPAALQCFGDIAQAIGAQFEKYLATVVMVLEQASTVKVTDNNYDHLEYVASLREGIMDGWGGIVLALKDSHGQTF